MARILQSLSRFASRERISEAQQNTMALRKPRFLFARDYVSPIALFSTMILITLLSVSVRGQGTITAIAKKLGRLDITTEVICRRQGKRPKVVVPMALQVGDKLISNSRTLTVRLECGAGKFTVSAPFRLTVISTGGKKCSVGYESVGGQLNVTDSGPTGVLSGATSMVSGGTIYGIKSTRLGKRGFRREWIVYDGKVSVKAGVTATTVENGQKLVATGRTALSIQRIVPEDIRQAAEAYAKIDVSQANISNPREREKAFVRLQALHQEILTAPNNQLNRIKLRDMQRELGVSDVAFVATETKPTVETKPPVETKSPVETKLPVETKPLTGLSVWQVELNANATTVESLSLGNPCKTMVRVKITAHVPFAHLISEHEIEIPAVGASEIRVEFNTRGRKSGDYKGELVLSCLNCSKADNCAAIRKRIPVNVHVKNGQVESTPVADRANPQDEQAALFELLSHGKYQETIPGFEQRVNEKRADSRDYYGLALAYEQLKDNKRTAAYANVALKLFEADHRMSKKEVVDCERIASGGPFRKVPAVKSEVHSVTLKTDTRTTISTDLQRSTCKKSHRLEISLKNLPFVHLSSGNEKSIGPEAEWALQLEFDTTGMKAGKYQGQVIISCLDCSNDKSCVASWYKAIQINLEVTGERRQ